MILEHVKLLIHAVIGTALLLIGVVLLVLPGPGLILVVAGLAMLARVFPGLERYFAPLRARALRAAEDAVSSRRRLAGSILAGVLLIAAGVVWGLVPTLPFGGWPTGSSVIVSGLILFALLIHSHRQVNGRGEPCLRAHEPHRRQSPGFGCPGATPENASRGEAGNRSAPSLRRYFRRRRTTR